MFGLSGTLSQDRAFVNLYMITLRGVSARDDRKLENNGRRFVAGLHRRVRPDLRNDVRDRSQESLHQRGIEL